MANNKEKEKQYALIETIDYNNGETPAESELHHIGTKEECNEVLGIISIKTGSTMKVNKSDWYSTYTDSDGIIHTFTIKTPHN